MIRMLRLLCILYITQSSRQGLMLHCKALNHYLLTLFESVSPLLVLKHYNLATILRDKLESTDIMRV